MNMKESSLHQGELQCGHWLDRYKAARSQTEKLCAPLEIEDYVIQTMPNVSPPKWHLAHVTWFFETFLLKRHLCGYQAFSDEFSYLFNSYYQAIGDPYPRNRRGLLSRPTVKDVYRYRTHVDTAVQALIETAHDNVWPEVLTTIELGVQHEQQHQELLLADIKHILASNPLRPTYHTRRAVRADQGARPIRWMPFTGGIAEIGYTGQAFHFDNEGPRHQALLQDYSLANRLVTNGEYLDFIEQGGYLRPELWLSDGWNTIQQEKWHAPLYWEKHGRQWQVMTLYGMEELSLDEPVCHVSFYEADAFARWAGARLPTEAELELALAQTPIEGNFVESGLYHPKPAEDNETQLYGDVWEWTQSPYIGYPNYQPLTGALGEYNGKFMCNQMVLKGGSCATPVSHIRATYRNFFTAPDRWQFTGIRLAKSEPRKNNSTITQAQPQGQP